MSEEHTAPKNELKSGEAVVRMTIGITRKETGKTDTFEVVGTPVTEEKPATEEKEK